MKSTLYHMYRVYRVFPAEGLQGAVCVPYTTLSLYPPIYIWYMWYMW